MASGEQHSPIKGQKISSSTASNRNSCDESQWKLLPNNLELDTRSKPSKKQRNKEKHRSFNQENLQSSPNLAEGFSCNPVTLQNFPRAKCNTASWLKDQMVNEEKAKRRQFDSDEVFSDSAPSLPRRGNMNFPVNVSECTQGSQRHPWKSMSETEKTRTLKEQLKKIISDREAMGEELSKLNKTLMQVGDEEREHEKLLQQMVSEHDGYVENGISPSSSTSKASNSRGNKVHRDSKEIATFCSEEEHTNKYNHLLEKMNQSQERIKTMKLKERLWYLQAKAENKLSSYQAAMNLEAHGGEKLPSEEPMYEEMLPRPEDQALMNSNPHWNAEASEQRPWQSEKQSAASDQVEQQVATWKDEPQDMANIQIGLEHIRKQVQSIQQISTSRNMAGSLSSDECDIPDVGERVAAVEWERKKLKNKLLELEEKQIQNYELLRELSSFTDVEIAANEVKNDDDSNFLPRSSRNSQGVHHTADMRKKEPRPSLSNRDMQNLQGILHRLDGIVDILCPEESTQEVSPNLEVPEMTTARPDARHVRSVATVKRDNVRKEQPGFPARRHYEAEGRANEDPDVPTAPAPTLSPALALDKLRDHADIQDEIRKLQMAQQQVKAINDLVASIREDKKSGLSGISVEQLRMLSYLGKEEEGNDSNCEDSGANSEDDGEYANMTVDGNTCQNSSTNPKAVCSEVKNTVLHDVDNHEQDNIDGFPVEMVAEWKKHEFDKFQRNFQKLLHMCSPGTRRNDPVRSSGEGGYTQNRNNPTDSVLTLSDNVRTMSSTQSTSHQDNLQLTRQNIASMESHNQNTSSNLHNRDCGSLKKDNINNLSGKMGKLSIQNAMSGSFSEVRSGTKDNLDTLSTFSSEMNQSSCLPDETERKNILDILKRHKKKQKLYDRNRDNQICCNSSVDSEPLEGSNSALAADTTVAATWGGSSTQENFEDEIDEPVESLGEQENGGGLFHGSSVLAVEKATIPDRHRTSTQVPPQFSDMQQYMESLRNIPDPTRNIPEKRHENFHQPSFTRAHQVSHDGCQRHTSKPKMAAKPSLPGATAGVAKELPCSTSNTDDVAKDYEQHLSSKFVQELKNHIDQLNALCQGLNERQQTSMNFHQSSGQSPNICQPLQPITDISQPYNQQLLLCLSQCYHALYMQQLEIQHLHRCIRHNIDAEVIHQVNNLSSQGSSSEDTGFRPWCMSTWSNPLVPSSLYPSDQISPMSSAPYLQLPMKPYPPLNTSASGARPVRAVIHPASQENRAAQETLNNQVPPRTRANNFWDNFRSYSRQNLLSTSNNIKRNENVGLPVAPQIRQVHPLVPNESINRTEEIPSYCSSSSSEVNRARPLLPNPLLQDYVPRSKKPNSNSTVGATANCSAAEFQKKTGSSNLNSSDARNLRSNRYHVQNMEPSLVPPVSCPASVNLVQLHPVQDDSKVGSFSSICPTSTSETETAHSSSEISNSSHNEYPSDFLVGLYREAKALKSTAHQKHALNIIRDLILSEKNGDKLPSQVKIQNDHSAPVGKTEAFTSAIPVQTMNSSSAEAVADSPEPIDAEKPAARALSENSVPWSSQNLPTAAIPPLSKHSTPTVSTGAVRKKPKLLSTCFWDTLSSSHTCSYESLDNEEAWDSLDHPPILQPSSRSSTEFPSNIVEHIILDLQSILPFGQMKEESSVSFWRAVNFYIIFKVRAHINVPLSHKAFSSLRQSVDQFLSRFVGSKFCDVESEFLKCIAEFLYEGLTCFVSTGRFASTTLPDDEVSVMEAADKMRELCVKMPVDSDDKTRELSISMPTDENDLFSVHFRSNLQQNGLHGAAEAENNSTIDVNIQPACVPSEEDVGCEFGPEAETEPEVEACTEADLAEADQSPGQQGTIGAGSSTSTSETWPVDQAAMLLSRSTGASSSVVALNGEEMCLNADSASDDTLSAQFCLDACTDQEVNLDDIPTKLCPASEEEPQRPLKEERYPLPPSDEANDSAENFAEKNNEELPNSK